MTGLAYTLAFGLAPLLLGPVASPPLDPPPLPVLDPDNVNCAVVPGIG